MEKKETATGTKATLTFETEIMRAASLGEQASVPDLQGEKILQNSLEFCLEEDDEIYEGYGRRSNAFPYRQYDAYTRALGEKPVKTAILENAFLTAVFLPEYGGRLWRLIDRRTGRNLLYTNNVLRFSNLAVRNAWFSGGVEWNIGVIGHSPFTTEALYTAVLENDSGSPVLRMYEFERVRGVFYQMDFWLDEDSTFLNCRMRVVNENSRVVPMYWWSNIAVPEYQGGRVVVPADRAFTYADGRVYKTDIPVSEGVDVTEYEKIPRSVDYFFDIPAEAPKYVANLDAQGYGLLQLSTSRLRSRKLFSWGHMTGSDHWQEFLTDGGGSYVEIQAGLGKTQYGCIPMAPHTAWEWMECYGAVDIGSEGMDTGKAPQEAHMNRRGAVEAFLRRENLVERAEKALQQTKALAKKNGETKFLGSGYGAMYAPRRLSAHLEFEVRTEGLKRWQAFLQDGILHEPQPDERPDEFFCNDGIFDLLRETADRQNKDNWYAHYQLAVCFLERGELTAAQREGEKSLSLAENPWALHLLACVAVREERREQAVEYLRRGIMLRRHDVSYLKQGFKTLQDCQAYREIIAIYEMLSEQEQAVSRLKFYYIQALSRTGMSGRAHELLEEGDGLELEDIREGEDSIARLWEETCAGRTGGRPAVPYRYDFKAY